MFLIVIMILIDSRVFVLRNLDSKVKYGYKMFFLIFVGDVLIFFFEWYNKYKMKIFGRINFVLEEILKDGFYL